MLKAICYVTTSSAAMVMVPGGALAASASPLGVAAQSAPSTLNFNAAMLWVATIIFVIVNGLLVYSLIRFRRKSAEAGSNQNIHHNGLLEAIWILIPVGILVALLLLTFQALQGGSP